MILYAFLIILQVLDAYTTYTSIKRGGRELNPVLLKFAEVLKPITNAKWAWLVFAKVVAVALGWVIYQAGAVEVMVVLCLFYVGVVIHNFKELSRGN